MNAPTPLALKVLRGNPGKRAIRPEPVPDLPESPPDPPEFLSEIAKGEWARIVLSLYRLRLITTLDLNVLAAYCQAFARWHEAETTLATMAAKDPVTHGILIKGAHGTPVVNPLVRVASVAAKDMVNFAGEFGLSPLARARIAAGIYENPPRSKFDGLLPGA
jgi:P27 family predicted phage terminase small subunit